MDDRRHFRPLDEIGRLRLDEGACLPLRSRFGQCRACEAACPAGVISVTVERVALAPGCLGCGRCVAACPNEALHCDGFESLEQPRVAEAPIELECARVPPASRTAAAVVVPCLGGISAGRLAQLHATAGRGGLCVVDRGWCGQCTAGSADRHPAAPAIEALRLWLDAIPAAGSDPVPAPALVARPLPLSLAAAAPAPAAAPTEAPTPRRQFLRTLAGRAPEPKPVPMGADGRAAFPARDRRPSPERRRLLEALEATAKRRGSALPAELFPRLFGTGACIDHRVCNAACPTGALRVRVTDSQSALHFDATACIGCGACTRACPEGALKLDSGGGGPLHAVLATHVPQTCESCGETFTPRGTEAVCLACSKSQRLLADVLSHRQAASG